MHIAMSDDKKGNHCRCYDTGAERANYIGRHVVHKSPERKFLRGSSCDTQIKFPSGSVLRDFVIEENALEQIQVFIDTGAVRANYIGRHRVWNSKNINSYAEVRVTRRACCVSGTVPATRRAWFAMLLFTSCRAWSAVIAGASQWVNVINRLPSPCIYLWFDCGGVIKL
jgi:hypothetical protein